MFTVATVLNALELGFIYALVAMALFLSYRVLNIADMTTDGAFTLGCAVSATAAVAGHPFLGLPLAMLAGAAAGFITAFLQTKLAVPSILAGIITNTCLLYTSFCLGWNAYGYARTTAKSIKIEFEHQGGSLPLSLIHIYSADSSKARAIGKSLKVWKSWGLNRCTCLLYTSGLFSIGGIFYGIH